MWTYHVLHDLPGAPQEGSGGGGAAEGLRRRGYSGRAARRGSCPEGQWRECWCAVHVRRGSCAAWFMCGAVHVPLSHGQ